MKVVLPRFFHDTPTWWQNLCRDRTLVGDIESLLAESNITVDWNYDVVVNFPNEETYAMIILKWN